MKFAPLAELVDALDLGSSAERCGSSSLPGGTKIGALADRLRQQFAKLSFRNGRVGSIPTCSAKLLKDIKC